MPRTTPLKRALLEAEVSQIDMARSMGIHVTLLNMIVNGNRRPTSDQAKAIARKLKVSRQELFEREDPNG